MKLYNMEQGSLEWYQRRLGIPTASNFHKICTPTGKPSTQSAKYAYRLIAERLLQETMDDQLGHIRWVERGREMEPDAVAQFQFVTDLELEQVGFITTDDGRLGCSPDRLVKLHPEAVEIKCPAAFTQIGYLLDGPGADYKPQVQGQLLVGDFDLVHFYSYHPRTPAVHIETAVDNVFRVQLCSALDYFLDELEAKTARARALGAYTVLSPSTPLGKAYPEAEQDPLQIVIPE